MMPDLLMPYLVSLVTTVVVVLTAVWAYFIAHRSAVSYMELNKKLPEAARWKDLTYRVADLQKQHDALASALAEAQATIEQAKRERDWLEAHRDEVAAARAEFEQIEERRAKLADLNDQIAKKTEEIKKLEVDAAKAEFHKQYADEKAAELEGQAEKIARSLEEMEQRRNQAQQKIDEAQGKLDEIREEYDRVRVDLAVAAKQLAESKVELESLHNELEAVKERRTKQEETLAQMRSEHDKLERHARKATVDVEALEHRRDRLGNDVSELISQQGALAPQTRGPESALRSLWDPVLKREQFPDDAMDLPDEIESLDKVSQYLNSLDLRFGDRVIKAFHTSLKISREAPLLVLAGISGTGKSLLPRRYAEAMGMHFLNVPVQPRWDGPQDLLGFFNYLDGEYKATELARALVQMDTFGPEKRQWPGMPENWRGSVNDRMLLVLLDEMNLARVEYYFSEFLSRLETRRDVNLDDPLASRAAEILLETGFVGQSAGVRVLPATNMLFVGTINEDESKQTLSDMVIDRSNIMRFGRPRQLKIETSGSVEEPPSSYIPSEVWDLWIEHARKTEKPLTKEVDNWIQELNVALGRVGRPFGFRTALAIREYITQYPDNSKEGVRCAMADQVEQRILPKLRGLDPSDRDSATLLRTVRDVVEELNDKELATAIESGMKGHGGHLFVWHGVDRSGVED